MQNTYEQLKRMLCHIIMRSLVCEHTENVHKKVKHCYRCCPMEANNIIQYNTLKTCARLKKCEPQSSVTWPSSADVAYLFVRKVYYRLKFSSITPYSRVEVLVLTTPPEYLITRTKYLSSSRFKHLLLDKQ